jgi:hypothetical protein
MYFIEVFALRYKYCAGADLGRQGSIVIHDRESGNIRIVDLKEVGQFKLGSSWMTTIPQELIRLDGPCYCIFEDVNGGGGIYRLDANLSQKAVSESVFQFGYNAGSVLAQLISAGWELGAVQVPVWRSKYPIKGKNASIPYAKGLMPDLADRITRHDIADAALISLLARQLCDKGDAS